MTVFLTWPNMLSLSRIAAIPIFVPLMLGGEPLYFLMATAVYAMAALSDGLDGYVARALRQETALGGVLDLVADKILVTTALLALIWLGRIEGSLIWAVIVILNRELLVSALRAAALKVGDGLDVEVITLSKWKTAIQMTAIGFLIAGDDSLWRGADAGAALLWIGAVLSCYTGYFYLRLVFDKCLRSAR